MVGCETKVVNSIVKIFDFSRYSNRTLKFHIRCSPYRILTPHFPYHLSWGCSDLLTKSSKHNGEVTEALWKKNKEF